MPSFRGKYIDRIVDHKSKTSTSLRRQQEETLAYTRELLGVLLKSVSKCEHVLEHRKDLQAFFDGKDQLDIAAKLLQEE